MRYLLLVLILSSVFMHLLYITVVNNLVPLNEKYIKVEKELDNLTQENIQLQDEILQNESLTTLSQKAKDRGFIPGNYLFLPKRGEETQ